MQVGLVALNLIGEPIGPGPDMPPGGYLQLHPPITREVPYNNYAAADMADLNLDLHVDTVGRAGGGGGGHGRSEPGPSCGHGVCGGRWEGGVLAVWGEGGMGEVLCKMCATVCVDGGGGRAGGKVAAGVRLCARGDYSQGPSIDPPPFPTLNPEPSPPQKTLNPPLPPTSDNCLQDP